MGSVQPWLSLDENVVLRAGAGTGKTHALISMAIGLLAGLRRGRGVEPHQLWLLTFGEQAAGELRARLRERIAPLAGGQPPELREPDVFRAAELLGVRLPSAEGWGRLLEQVGAINATTLHAASAALLRELGGPSLSGFEVLDAEGADELLVGAAQEAILDAPSSSELQALLEDLGYRGMPRLQSGLVEALRDIHKRLAEDGLEAPLGAAPAAPAAADLEAMVRRAKVHLTTAAAGHDLPLAARAAAGLEPPAGTTLTEALDDAWGEIEGGRIALGKLRKHGASEAKDAIGELAQLLATARASAHGAAFRALLAAVQTRYRAAKARRGVLDFSDLCNRARNLLRDHPAARRAAKARLGVLLLDETQDTSQVQVDLCLMLCEAREAEAALDASKPVADQVRLERGVLCAVGDRKQSIYEFRGANVAVFEQLAGAVVRSGGRSELLDTSRRSHPALVGFVNRFFAQAMLEGRPGVPGFGADDALREQRPAFDLPPAVLLSLSPPKDETAEAARRREARAVAERAAALLRQPPEELRRAVGGELQPGHLALLFRRLTHLELFRAALAEVGLPGVLLGGDGFWERPEVFDAVALLSAVLDPDDGLATLTLLRSPLCGITDASLGRLAFSRPGKRLSLRWLWEELPGTLSGDERQRLLDLGEALRDLRQASRGLGAGGLLRAAERELHLRARYADAQVSANLDKLELKAGIWQAGGESLPATVRRLFKLTRDRPRESLAPAFDNSQKDAVRLLSVHASKGLEFPVTFVVECGAVFWRNSAPALYARGVGLGLKARQPSGKWANPGQYKQVQEAMQLGAEAEALRLFYVAATRARDLLFFSGELPRGGGKESWRSLLEAHGPAAGLVTEEVSGAAPLGSGPLFGAPIAAVPAELSIEACLTESAPLPRLPPSRLPLAASAAGDLSLCPRRFQLRQLWQIKEQPEVSEDLRDLPYDEDPRALGSLAHRLLEVVDLGAVAEDPEAALRSAAAQVSSEQIDPDVMAEVRSVLSSPLGQRMTRLPAAQVRREVPFLLRLGSKPTLVATGSIDLLLVLDDRVVVLDYKRGSPQHASSYQAQVRLYALAAHELTGGVLPVHAGLWFLRAGRGDPGTAEVTPEELAQLRRELVKSAQDIAGRDGRRSLFPGREARHCRAIGCGYLSRCHG